MLKAEDISAEKIKSGIGGYKKRETEEYIGTLQREYEILIKENLELKDKLSVLSEGVQYYKNMEKSLQKALVLAEKTTSDTMQAAEAKAAAMEKEAQSHADVLIKEAKMRADSYEKETHSRADAYEKEVKMRADSYRQETAVEAAKLIQDTKQEADKEIASANEQLRKIHSQIMTLIQQYEQYKSQYKQLAMAQMQVLESEAYNLDAPILKTIRPREDDTVSLERDFVVTDKENLDNSQEIVESIKTPVQPENTEEEKKIYVDARGEVVEVHEFREITVPGGDSTVDPWETETEEDVKDDFDNFTHEYEGPYSFSEDEVSVKEAFTDSNPTHDFPTNTTEESEIPVQPDIGDTVISASNNENASLFNEVDTTTSSNNENTSLFNEVDTVSNNENVSLSNETDIASNNENADLFNEADTTFNNENAGLSNGADIVSNNENVNSIKDVETESNIMQNNGNMHNNSGISLEEMKRIERMQLERLKEQEEKQLEKLKSERYHNYSNTQTNPKVQESKKEQDPADIFRALHKNDDGEPTVTLQDLKQQQELENSSVSLPKATEQSVPEQQTKKVITPPPMDDFLSFEPLDLTKKDNKFTEETITSNRSEKNNSAENDFFHQLSEQSENDFHATPFVEEGNSLDFEMDNNQNVYNSDQRETPKFKSFREFESEL